MSSAFWLAVAPGGWRRVSKRAAGGSDMRPSNAVMIRLIPAGRRRCCRTRLRRTVCSVVGHSPDRRHLQSSAPPPTWRDSPHRPNSRNTPVWLCQVHEVRAMWGHSPLRGTLAPKSRRTGHRDASV